MSLYICDKHKLVDYEIVLNAKSNLLFCFVKHVRCWFVQRLVNLFSCRGGNVDGSRSFRVDVQLVDRLGTLAQRLSISDLLEALTIKIKLQILLTIFLLKEFLLGEKQTFSLLCHKQKVNKLTMNNLRACSLPNVSSRLII